MEYWSGHRWCWRKFRHSWNSSAHFLSFRESREWREQFPGRFHGVESWKVVAVPGHEVKVSKDLILNPEASAKKSNEEKESMPIDTTERGPERLIWMAWLAVADLVIGKLDVRETAANLPDETHSTSSKIRTRRKSAVFVSSKARLSETGREGQLWKTDSIA